MMQLCWTILLLCLSANAETTVLYRESGENVTLKCSSEGCPSSIKEYTGMYLYLKFKQPEEVFYYYKEKSNETISIRNKFKNRIQKKGSLKNHTITISNLTVEDAGSYQCVYTLLSRDHVQCKVYTLVVRGPIDAASASGSAIQSAHPLNPKEPTLLPAEGEVTSVTNRRTCEKSTSLVLVILVSCAISTLVTMTFILLIPRVKKWTRSRRMALQQATEDNVYESMGKNSLSPFVAPGNSPPNPNDFA